MDIISKKSNHKDFLIISFNEEEADYSKAIMNELLEKIYKELPAIIFVCTQESRSGNSLHFQHIFEDKLKKKNIYDRLLKVDGSKFTFKVGFMNDRNCRTRIFYNKNRIVLNIDGIKKTYKNSKKIEITSIEKKITDKSGLHETYSKAAFKNAILTKVILKYKQIEYKFIVINTHLFFTDSGLTLLHERKKQFLDLVNEFDLNNLYKIHKFNIFFCGDLNFRLFEGNIYKRNLSNTNLTTPKKIFALLKPNDTNNNETKYNKARGIINLSKQLNRNNPIKNELYNILIEEIENNKLKKKNYLRRI